LQRPRLSIAGTSADALEVEVIFANAASSGIPVVLSATPHRAALPDFRQLRRGRSLQTQWDMGFLVRNTRLENLTQFEATFGTERGGESTTTPVSARRRLLRRIDIPMANGGRS